MKSIFIKMIILSSLLVGGCSSDNDKSENDANVFFLSSCSSSFVNGDYFLQSSIVSPGLEANLKLHCFYEEDFLLDAIDNPSECSFETNIFEQDRLSLKNRGVYSDGKFILDIVSECSDLSVLNGTRLFGQKGCAKSFNCQLDFHYSSLIAITRKIRSYKKNFVDGDKNVIADSKNHIVSTSYYDDNEDLSYETSVSFVFDDSDSTYKPISIQCIKTFGKTYSRNKERIIQVISFSRSGSLERSNIETFIIDDRIDYYNDSRTLDQYSTDQTWFSSLFYRFLIYNQFPSYKHPHNDNSL